MRVFFHALVTATIVTGVLGSTGCSESATGSGEGNGNGGLTTQAYKVSIAPKQQTIGIGVTKNFSASVSDAAGLPVARTVVWTSADPSIASVSTDGSVVGIAAGRARIIATVGVAADTATAIVSSDAPTFQIVPSAVTIGEGLSIPFTVSSAAGLALPNAGVAVRWSISDESVAQVSSDGVVTTVGPGAVVLKAEIDGASAFAAVQVDRNPVASNSVEPLNSTLLPGETIQLVSSPRDDLGRPVAGRNIKWSSNNNAVATVSSTGLVTAVAKGTAVITSQADSKKATATVIVLDVPVTTISVAVNPNPLSVGQKTTAQATLRDSNGTPLTGRVVAWQSSNSVMAAVDAAGIVTARLAGTVTISAVSEGKVGSISLTIGAATPASIGVSTPNVAVTLGQTAQLTAQVKDASGNVIPNRVVTWSSASPTIATITVAGQVTGLAAGSATVTATADGLSANAIVTVTSVPAATVTVTPGPSHLAPGGSLSFAAVARDAAGNVLPNRVATWSSSNPTVATMSANGTVTAVSAGTATVTATIDNAVGTAQVTVDPATVTVPVASVAVALGASTLSAGQTTQATATVRDAAGNVLTGRAVSWSSADPSLATVSANGVVTAVAAGSATILATVEGKAGAASLVVAAPAPQPVASVSVTAPTTSLIVPQTTQLTVVLRDAAGNPLSGRTIGWSTGNTSVASVSAGGLVTAMGAGTTVITATSEGKSGSVTENVASNQPAAVATVTVQVGQLTLTVGQQTQATAILRDASGNLLSNRTIVWSASNGNATVSSTGSITAVAAGTTSIIATTEGRSGSSPTMTLTAVVNDPPSSTGIDAVRRVLGTLPSVPTVEAAGATLQTYEQSFRKWSDYHWAAHGATWDASNYYDRAMIYYAWWTRTGNATYLDRGNQIALSYRTGYLEAQPAPYQYNASSYWYMPTGIALHYLATGDEASRRAVGYSAEWLTSNWFYSRLGGHTEMENRIRSRLLQAAVLAHAINAPQGGPAVGQVVLAPGTTWAAKSKNILNEILKAQGADGSWKDAEHCGYEKPFMDALLMESLILYYRLVEADPRIPGVVKKTADYVYTRDWLGASRGFIYLEGSCTSPTTNTPDGPSDTPDLTLMFPSMYAWLAKTTGDATYMTRADELFNAGVATAYYQGSKQFNQAYTNSFKYLGSKLP